MRRFYFSIFFVASLVLAASLLSLPTPVAALDREAIIDGTRVPSSDYAAVASVFPGSDLCTGTLVSPKHILTAAHCFFDENDQRAVGNFGTEVQIDGSIYRSVKVSIHPSYVSRSDACTDNEIDAALIELDREISDIDPIALLKTPLAPGTTLLLVGYGYEGTASQGQISGQRPPDGEVDIGTTTINTVGKTYLTWTFKAGESNTAAGDSGGPSFLLGSDGSLQIAGITCGGTGNAQAGTRSFNTRSDRMAAWVDAVTGVEPLHTPASLEGPLSVAGVVGTSLKVAFEFGGSTLTGLRVSGMPPGLTLEGTVLRGRPKAAGHFTLQVTAINNAGSAHFNIPLVITEAKPSMRLTKALLRYRPRVALRKLIATKRHYKFWYKSRTKQKDCALADWTFKKNLPSRQ